MLRRTTTLGSLLFIGLALQGCTAGIATAKLVRAQQSLVDARDRGAETLAPYEYTLAQRHMHKALEEHGDAEYKVCVDLSAAAAGWAEASIVRMEGGGRDIEDLGRTGEDLSDRALFEDELFNDKPEPIIEVVPQPEPEPEPEDEFLTDPEDDAWDGEAP